MRNGFRFDIELVAQDFFNSYLRCIRFGDTVVTPNGSKSKYYPIPAIAIGCFACELYLKALIKRNGTNDLPKTHNLEDLFKYLKGKQQNYISEKFSSSNFHLPFSESLKLISEGFEDWRYIYENSNFDLEIKEDCTAILNVLLPILEEMTNPKE